MWNYVGIVRSTTRLRRAARRIALLQEEIVEYYWKYFVTRDLLELRNIATRRPAHRRVRRRAAHESRGLHFTIDYPDDRPEARARHGGQARRAGSSALACGAVSDSSPPEPRRPPDDAAGGGALGRRADHDVQIVAVSLTESARPGRAARTSSTWRHARSWRRRS